MSLLLLYCWDCNARAVQAPSFACVLELFEQERLNAARLCISSQGGGIEWGAVILKL